MKKSFLLSAIVAAAVACSPKTYTIVQVADSQLGFDAAVKAQVPGAEYVNDLTYESDCMKRAAEYMCEADPDMIVFTGDQVNYPQDRQQWDAFEELLTLLPSEARVMHLPGNHDVLISEGKVDNTPFASRYGDDRFVHRIKGFCIVGLNSNLIKYDDPGEEDQFQWLKDVLESAGEDIVKIVFCHHPFFLADIEEGDSYFPIQKAKRLRYFELFAQNGVVAVYAGHLHDNAEGEYKGVQMKTATSVAYQIGQALPSLRLIELKDIRGHKSVHDRMQVIE